MSEQIEMLDVNSLRDKLNESDGPQDYYDLGIRIIEHILYLQNTIEEMKNCHNCKHERHEKAGITKRCFDCMLDFHRKDVGRRTFWEIRECVRDE